MVFPVVMYGCESWTVKKAERRRTDAFELWCWRRLESPLDCKEIQPVHSEDQPWNFFGGNVETVTNFIFLGSKITVDSDCSHEIKRRLLLGRKAMTKLDSILKSRDITLPPNVLILKAMVFPVVMYGYESWTIKKTEQLKN